MEKISLKLRTIHKNWLSQWEPSLALWSPFTKLHSPVWCFTEAEEKQENLANSFAMIRLQDHSVVLSLRLVEKMKLEKYSREILAHEIGHHVYTPADLTDNARLMARTRAGLSSREHMAGFVSNLYTDLLINDRLKRSVGLDMSGVYKAIGEITNDRLWNMYMRIYEILWSLSQRTLAQGKIDEEIATDAQLGARLIRSYAKDWLEGAGRFAALCLPYLLKDEAQKTKTLLLPFMDTEKAGAGQEVPDGMTEVGSSEKEGAIHPAFDPAFGDIEEAQETGGNKRRKTTPHAGKGRAKIGGRKNNYRTPREYTDLIKSLGVKVDEQDITIRYYRERALPHLIPFPMKKMPHAQELIKEGEDPWEIGSPQEEIDWISTLIRSPYVIPGITTVQAHYGTTQGGEPEKKPVNLYLGIDCSGSMPNPRYQLSFPVLAGTIMCLSALRVGASVMVVLSGEPGEFSATNGFTRDEHEVMKILTGYLGTGYAFGIQRLEDAFLKGEKLAAKTHIIIITDSDIFSMLHGGGGWKIAREALTAAGGGGTYVLHRVNMNIREVQRMQEDKWDVFALNEWESLIKFARDFSRKQYEKF